jgi:hypothetical protein
MTNIQLHVGYIGITREGRRVEITHRDDGESTWPCESYDGEWYTDSGSFWSRSKVERRDIIGPWVETPVEPQVNYNDGNWHRWDGATSECPVHIKSVVEYVWHDEIGMSGVINRVSGWDGSDTRIKWSQVIKFRVTKEYVAPVEPREFWVVPATGKCFMSKPAYTPAVHVREVI